MGKLIRAKTFFYLKNKKMFFSKKVLSFIIKNAFIKRVDYTKLQIRRTLNIFFQHLDLKGETKLTIENSSQALNKFRKKKSLLKINTVSVLDSFRDLEKFIYDKTKQVFYKTPKEIPYSRVKNVNDVNRERYTFLNSLYLKT